VTQAHLAVICSSVGRVRASEVYQNLQVYNPKIRCLDLAREVYLGPHGRTILGGVGFVNMINEVAEGLYEGARAV
jgi:hypothetical protein